jgi:hypothetical protein
MNSSFMWATETKFVQLSFPVFRIRDTVTRIWILGSIRWITVRILIFFALDFKMPNKKVGTLT